jgi:hypothetical protein
VARHVLIKLLFDGDMDGHTTDQTSGEILKAPKMFGILKRRHFWTLVIYVATLVPALFLNDLGPVLSITGAIGGCSLAYIGPGKFVSRRFPQDDKGSYDFFSLSVFCLLVYDRARFGILGRPR